MNKREKINIQIRDIPYVYIDDSIFEGDIEEVSKNILNLRKRLEEAHVNRAKNLTEILTPFEQYEKIHLSISSSGSYGTEYELKVYRKETDVEYKESLKKEKEYQLKIAEIANKRKQTIESKELALLEKLKKKYDR